MENHDLSPDLNAPGSFTTDERNRALDSEILRTGEEIAGLELRPITAGDLALLIESGVGLVIGRTDSIAYDVGAILYSQSRPRDTVRRVAARSKGAFRDMVYEFLDLYEPGVFAEATPRIVALVDRMNSVRTAVKGEIAGSGSATDPKVGDQVG
jgi:hypothetical protein